MPDYIVLKCAIALKTYYVFKLSDSGESPPDLKEIPQKSISSAVLFILKGRAGWEIVTSS